MGRLGTAAADVVEQNPFARALVGFMEVCPNGKWSGLAGVLVEDVIPRPDPLPKGWPQDPTRFGVWVNRYGRVLETAAGHPHHEGGPDRAGAAVHPGADISGDPSPREWEFSYIRCTATARRRDQP